MFYIDDGGSPRPAAGLGDGMEVLDGVIRCVEKAGLGV